MAVATGLQHLIDQLARLPGLGERSARRVVLHMLRHRDGLMLPLADSLREVAQSITACAECGNWDTQVPCSLCRDAERDASRLCVVEQPSDLWALERTHAYRGQYFVLGGVLSALMGSAPQQLRMEALHERVRRGVVKEVILATNATVEGQTTADYIAMILKDCPVTMTRLACGVPVGGELDYLDSGTLVAAFQARLPASLS